MTVQDLRTLLDYHYWARDRMLDAVQRLTPDEYSRDMKSSFRSVRETVVHIYFAEWAWHSRWVGHSPTARLSADLFPDVPAIRATWIEHEAKMRGFLESLGEAGVSRQIDYKMISGEPGRSVFWHMLQHVVNHASYHRGQVTTMLRQLGAAPPRSMDLIGFYRERGV